MSRTKRNVAYKHYWGMSKKDFREWIDSTSYTHPRAKTWKDKMERDYLLFGTDARNYCYKTHEYFNRANRVGRRVARDQLRPHIVLGENFDFDDSRYRARYKGVWWDIY